MTEMNRMSLGALAVTTQLRSVGTRPFGANMATWGDALAGPRYTNAKHAATYGGYV